MPNLGMADRELELWTGSNMDLSDHLAFEPETGPVRGLAHPDMGWADLALSLRTGSNIGLTHPELGLRICVPRSSMEILNVT